ncbi:MAG: TonB-dependent receptor, partial [Candidatus Eremiobacteraeota bacterium]|nr:TonB-dependent receptor [Candidatus Eremiobacteraeota bacterium]
IVAFFGALVMVGTIWSQARALAVQYGDVQGTVTDASGMPIAQVHIALRAAGHGEEAVSDASGHFTFSGIAALTYAVTAQAKGFSTLSGRLVTVAADQTTTIALQLARAGTGNIATLGSVTVNGRQTVSTSSAPTALVDPQRLAALGAQNVTDDLAQQIALTMTRPAGGAPGLPQTASLRGPDPSETLIDIDGHEMNNANTGDFDLQLLDPSEFSNIQVVYGVGPASLGGANTQGGTINFHTIDPTTQDHGVIRASAGSFDTSGYTLQATGTADQRLGYALSYHHYYSAGAVSDYLISYEPVPSLPVVDQTTVGSAINASSTLAKLRYAFGATGGFVQVSYWSTAAYRDLSGPLSFPDNPQAFGPGSLFTAFPGASVSSISPAYALDLQLPLGNRGAAGIAPSTLTVRHLTSTIDQSTPNLPPGYNSYLLDERDVLGDDSAQWDRYLPNATFSFYADFRREQLTLPPSAPFAPGVTQQSEDQTTYAARAQWDPTTHLHYSAVLYFSRYSTFGTSTDPRLALVWTPNSNSMLRCSFGTGFRAPLLTELAINPNLTAEHTSEYELGYQEHLGGSRVSPTFEVDAYHTNLRDPIYFAPSTNPALGQFSFIENLGDVVYTGAEFRAEQPLSSSAVLKASYGIAIAYPVTNPAQANANAPPLVAGEQFQGIPPHKALLSVDGSAAQGFSYTVGAGWEAENNELNRPSFWLYNANVGKQFGHTQLTLSAQNLGNEFADKFTLINTGPPYSLVPTNAFSLPGLTLAFTVTQHV